MNARTIWTLTIASAILFTVPLLLRDLLTPDEPRYALVAQEMMWSGGYLVPMRNGGVHKEKPPLLFWAIAGVSAPVGSRDIMVVANPLALDVLRRASSESTLSALANTPPTMCRETAPEGALLAFDGSLRASSYRESRK